MARARRSRVSVRRGETPRYNQVVAIDKVLEHALALDASQRAELAAALLRSLEPDDGETLDEAEWNAAWSAELQRRLSDLEAGRATPVAHSEAMSRLRGLLPKR